MRWVRNFISDIKFKLKYWRWWFGRPPYRLGDTRLNKESKKIIRQRYSDAEPKREGDARMDKETMTIKEVARYLRTSERSVYSLVKEGKLPATMILSKWRFDRETVRAFGTKEKK